MSQSYMTKEVFYSLQGEGVRAGTANTFVRFVGCNLNCNAKTDGFNCDTDFRNGIRMTLSELVLAIKLRSCLNVIFTGGEPCLQLDYNLAWELKKQDYYLAMETNGTVEPKKGVADLLDWITVSPKGMLHHEWTIRPIQEIKYVIRDQQPLPMTMPGNKYQNLVLSPAFDNGRVDPYALQWCIFLCKKFPMWRLSVQQHQGWGIQ